MRQNRKKMEMSTGVAMPAGVAMPLKMALAASLLAVCVSITGCGGINTGVDRAVSDSAVSGSAVSGSAVSGSAVSGSAVSGGAVSGGAIGENAVRDGNEEDGNTKNSQKIVHTEAKQYRCSTDTNVYYEDYDDKNRECIVQARFDGSHKEKIVDALFPVNEDYTLSLVSVDENWLYYVWEPDEEVEDDRILYRIPLEKDSEGYDVAKTSEKEEVIRAYCINLSLWSSHEVLLYDEKVMIYDVQKKKTVSEWNEDDLGIDYVLDSFEILRLKDYFVLLTERGVYAMKMGGTQWKKCKDRGKCVWGYFDSVVHTENSFFYTDKADYPKIRIKKCDGKNVQTFITPEQMFRAAKRAKQIKTDGQIKECRFNDMYVQDDRLYIQLELHWKEDGVYRMEYVLFSQGENETELRYEKKLTECMQSHVKNRKGEFESSVSDVHTNTSKKTIMEKNAVANDAQCVAMLNGKVYLSLYDYEKNQGRMGCYNMSNGKFRWAASKEVLYGELRWSGINMEEVYKTKDDNSYVGFKGGNLVEAE